MTSTEYKGKHGDLDDKCKNGRNCRGKTQKQTSGSLEKATQK